MTPLPRLPHYADRAVERYGYLPQPPVMEMFVRAIEGHGPAEIGVTLIERQSPEREIWDVLVLGSAQRVVFCPQTRTILTFLPAGPKPPRKPKRPPSLGTWYGRSSAKQRRPRVEVVEEV